MSFELYKAETPYLKFEDYGLIIEEVKRANAKTALEFGPGASTLALIESGLERIVTCEHDRGWREKAKTKFRDFPQVKVIAYLNEPIAVAEIDRKFDIAFVDSPQGYVGARVVHPGQEDWSRLNTCLLALEHAPIVVLHDAIRPLERGSLGCMSAMGHQITILPSPYGMARIERANG